MLPSSSPFPPLSLSFVLSNDLLIKAPSAAEVCARCICRNGHRSRLPQPFLATAGLSIHPHHHHHHHHHGRRRHLLPAPAVSLHFLLLFILKQIFSCAALFLSKIRCVLVASASFFFCCYTEKKSATLAQVGQVLQSPQCPVFMWVHVQIGHVKWWK